MGDLVRRGLFDDMTHYKLLFSVGGGSNSTRPGALYTTLKVSRILNYFHFFLGTIIFTTKGVTKSNSTRPNCPTESNLL